MYTYLVRFNGVPPSDPAANPYENHRTYILTYYRDSFDIEVEEIREDEARVEKLKANRYTHPIYRNYSRDGSGITLYTTLEFYERQYAPLIEKQAKGEVNDSVAVYFSFHATVGGDKRVCEIMCEKLSQGWQFMSPVSSQVEMVLYLDNEICVDVGKIGTSKDEGDDKDIEG